jgi:GT2 family glycosyltransferase/glycosyltransferase involved in cell wall biosynthesis
MGSCVCGEDENRRAIVPGSTEFKPMAAPSRFESLFDEMAVSIERGQIASALRLADRARRIAPCNPLCHVLNAQLLILSGAPRQAVELLQGKSDPEAIVTRGQAFQAQGLLGQASECCLDLLRRFAVDSVAKLRDFASGICQVRGSHETPGWIGVDSGLRLVGEARNSSRLDIRVSDGFSASVACAEEPGGFAAFEYSLPNGVSGAVTACVDGEALLGSGLSWPPDFEVSGWVAFDGKSLVGEARLGWSPNLPVTLTIGRSGESQRRIYAVKPVPDPGPPPFSIQLNRWELAADAIDVSVLLPNGNQIPLVGSPLELQRRRPTPIGPRPHRNAGGGRCLDERAGEVIDIVIPVYAGFDETLECLGSVLDSTDRADAEVVVVNDASPDARLCEELVRLSDEARITLLTNPANVGFPGAVNVGMRLHPGRDVILLNSDTKVSGDWLSRLRDAARSAEDIGTVTPMSEAGSITDYVRRDVSVAEIDRIAGRVNAGKVVDLPVGVGLCLYVRRKCLEETGEFDETAFASGYGEESDFCLRARSLGWRHIAATDVFVGHKGGLSYGRKKDMLKRRNRRVLNFLHPGYDKLVDDFTAENPLQEARRAIDMQLLLDRATRPVLLITGRLPGGVKRHVGQRQAELSSAGHTVVVLQPADEDGPPRGVTLEVDSLGLRDLVFDLPGDMQLLGKFSLELGLSHIELHHFLDIPSSFLEFITTIGIPYNVYIHDYLWVCPRITLIGGDGRYCGEPPIEDCEACVQTHGSSLTEPATVAALRARSSVILRGANRAIAPSWDARERLARYFSGLAIEVIPWEDPAAVPVPAKATALAEPLPQPQRIRVAVIGAIGIQKGFQVLLDCARDAAARNLNLEFIVIGYSLDDELLMATGRVFITGPYDEEEIGDLLERERCDIAFFPSIFPETWCYALTYALARNMPVVAFDRGALAERLRSNSKAHLVRPMAGGGQINDSLQQAMGRKTISNSLEETPMDPTPTTTDQPESHGPVARELTSSVQVLNLPEGIYTVSIAEGAPPKGPTGEMALPALQVGLAPVRSSGSVDFLTGASTFDRWLAYDTDRIVIKIVGGDAALFLTSVHAPDSPVLAVDIKRLPAQVVVPANGPAAPQEETAGGATDPRVQILTHIRNVGDLQFTDSWAGWPGQQLWIEAFAISVLGPLPSDAIEYCGILANGLRTPWIGNQAICGSRGAGLPMLGFAVRLKPEFAELYDLEYAGQFISGAFVGPLADETSCRSNQPGDALEAIEIRITARQIDRDLTPISEPQYSLDT